MPGLVKVGISVIGAFLYLSILCVLLLRWVNPPTSSFMLQRSASAWWNSESDFELHYSWADWEEISPYLKVAAITSEDQSFAEHWGFDFQSMKKAVEEYQRGQGLRGASTISQQVAKNLFLWPGQSFIRKGIEAWFTLLIEWTWPKKRILEVYLNIAEFGDGVYGVEAASQIYFNKKAGQLDMINSSLMVTALPSPKRYNLHNPSPYMIDRRNWILQYMLYLGHTDYLERLE